MSVSCIPTSWVFLVDVGSSLHRVFIIIVVSLNCVTASKSTLNSLLDLMISESNYFSITIGDTPLSSEPTFIFQSDKRSKWVRKDARIRLHPQNIQISGRQYWEITCSSFSINRFLRSAIALQLDVGMNTVEHWIKLCVANPLRVDGIFWPSNRGTFPFCTLSAQFFPHCLCKKLAPFSFSLFCFWLSWKCQAQVMRSITIFCLVFTGATNLYI